MLTIPLTLSRDQKRILRNASRLASRRAQRRILPAEILDRLLHESEVVYDVSDSYYAGSPRQLANAKKQAMRERMEIREARAFLRAEYRRLSKDGLDYPTHRACDALARKLRCSVGYLDFAMRPPEWSLEARRAKRRGAWWCVKAKSRPKFGPLDDRSWPGRPEEISPAEREERRARRAAAFAADVEIERERLEKIAEARGGKVDHFCAAHGYRLFRCEHCIRPKWEAHADGYEYGDSLRCAIFGDKAVHGSEPASSKPRALRHLGQFKHFHRSDARTLLPARERGSVAQQ
jgi:hypothetical protein